jgi:predicted amidohydrolase
MKIALGQFAVGKDADANGQTCVELMRRAAAGGADLLVLPEGVLARDITDPGLVRRAAQPLDGPFVTRLLEASRAAAALTTVFCIHVPAGAEDGRVWNTLVALRGGRLLARYRKLHLYDAFAVRESANVVAGAEIPPLIDVAGMKVGLMTCYDLRFPELARRLALDGADVLVLPSAWVRGPLKEMHWDVLVAARALENTVYLAAAGECGTRNIGASLLVDPLGVIVARAAEAPALLFGDADAARIREARANLPVLANRRFARPELA